MEAMLLLTTEICACLSRAVSVKVLQQDMHQCTLGMRTLRHTSNQTQRCEQVMMMVLLLLTAVYLQLQLFQEAAKQLHLETPAKQVQADKCVRLPHALL